MKPLDLDITDYQEMVEMFNAESDRGAAVLAGSYIENYLGVFLITKLKDNTLTETIFGNNGSLATFAQRIDFAQAFGYLHKDQCKSLHILRKIRNHFSHHPKSASFTEDPVRSWVNSLSSSKEITFKNGEKFKLDDPKISFLVTAGFIVSNIHNIMLAESLK